MITHLLPSVEETGITVTDQFCGAGGNSIACRRSGLQVSLAMNHWKLAVETHKANFPDTQHDIADVQVVHPGRYWATDILITSPSCTDHTYAKGVKRRVGQLSFLHEQNIDPAAIRSRATMWTVPEYAEHHDYRIIIVENVVETRKWRPWDGWLLAMHNLGYEHNIVYLNSMFAHLRPLTNPQIGDFAPQSRDRMYVVFWKKGNARPDLDLRPSGWCPHCEANVEAVQSWKKRPGTAFWQWGRYGTQYVYRCPSCTVEVAPYYYGAANAIDWNHPINRIGDRKRPLIKRTMARMQMGMDTYGRQKLRLNTSYPCDKQVRPDSAALYTRKTAKTLAETTPFLLGYANGNSPPRSVKDPLRTIHTANGQGLVVPSTSLSVNDAGYRMLQPDEIGRGMAFDGDYTVLGTKGEQIRQYGNAVTPPAMQRLLERCVKTLI